MAGCDMPARDAGRFEGPPGWRLSKTTFWFGEKHGTAIGKTTPDGKVIRMGIEHNGNEREAMAALTKWASKQ